MSTYEIEFQLPTGCFVAYIEAETEDAARVQLLDAYPLAEVQCVYKMPEKACQ